MGRTTALSRGSFLLQEAGKEIYSCGFNQQNLAFLEAALIFEGRNAVGEEIANGDRAVMEVVG